MPSRFCKVARKAALDIFGCAGALPYSSAATDDTSSRSVRAAQFTKAGFPIAFRIVVTNGTCSAFVTTLTNECKNLSTSGKKCNNVVDAAKTLCGPNAGDAGTDGG